MDKIKLKKRIKTTTHKYIDWDVKGIQEGYYIIPNRKHPIYLSIISGIISFVKTLKVDKVQQIEILIGGKIQKQMFYQKTDEDRHYELLIQNLQSKLDNRHFELPYQDQEVYDILKIILEKNLKPLTEKEKNKKLYRHFQKLWHKQEAQ